MRSGNKRLRAALVVLTMLLSLLWSAAPAQAASVKTATPKVAGSAKVGQVLTAKPGRWRPSGVTFSYQWLRNGHKITGATAVTYELTASDLGKRISVKVTGSKPGYAKRSETSSRTAKVKLGTLTAAVPTIAGTLAAGQQVSAQVGAWQPAGISFSYDWQASGLGSIGTGSSVVLPNSVIGRTITVTVTGARAGFGSQTRTSAASAAVAKGALSAPVPTISGTAQVGATLTGSAGTWGPAPVSLSYQWLRAGTAISGATGTSYKLVAADQGKQLTFAVTGAKDGYATQTRTSAATAAIAAAPTTPTGPTATVKARTQRMADANLTSGQNGWYEVGAKLTLSCYKRGQAVQGFYSSVLPNGGWDDLWYKVSDGYFVADVDIDTGSNNPVTGACATASTAEFKLPFPKGTKYYITQGPAQHAAGISPAYNKHAVDFGMDIGTTVVASAGGTIWFEGVDSTGGIQVRVNHGNGRCSQYAHLSRTVVNKGQQVSQGQKIGESGNTGASSGPHLHWNVVSCSLETSLETPNSVEMGTNYPVGWSAVSVNG